MTSISRSAAGIGARRPSTPLRRALGLEWRLHRERFLLFAGLSLLTVLLSALIDLRIGVLGLLLAARLPVDLADRVPEEGQQLRSALGISRAQAVSARTLMVCAGQLVLGLGVAAGILIGDWPPEQRHWMSFDIRATSQVGPDQMTLPDHLVDIGLWAGALLWTHALTGGRAFSLGARLHGRVALARFFGILLLAGLGFAGAVQLIELILPAGEDSADLVRHGLLQARLAQGLMVTVTLGGGILALLLAHRRWLRRA